MASANDEQRQDELTAYLDGELDAHAATEFERRLQDDPSLRHEAETLKRTWELLDFLPQPEPAANFTSRTLDKLSIVVPARSATTTSQPTLIAAPARNPWPKRLALAAAAIAVFLVGYGLAGLFLSQGSKPLTPQERDEQMARDLRLLDRLPLYQHGDDLDFVRGLDDPDLFGEQ